MLERCKIEPALKALGGAFLLMVTMRPCFSARLMRSSSGVASGDFRVPLTTIDRLGCGPVEKDNRNGKLRCQQQVWQDLVRKSDAR